MALELILNALENTCSECPAVLVVWTSNGIIDSAERLGSWVRVTS